MVVALSLLLLQGSAPQSPPPQVSDAQGARLVALEATCHAGRLEQCLELARLHLRSGRLDSAQSFYEKACGGGVAEGCVAVASRFAGLADQAIKANDAKQAVLMADRGLHYAKQGAKLKPNLLEAVVYEAALSRQKAATLRGKGDAVWNARADELERRAAALKAVALSDAPLPDLFWKPER